MSESAISPQDFSQVHEGGDPRFKKILKDMWDLHVKKSADYGADEDPLANLRACEEMAIPAWKGVVVRIGDKIHRIRQFCRKNSLKNESLQDSLMDLAAYSILALILFEETQHKEDNKPGR